MFGNVQKVLFYALVFKKYDIFVYLVQNYRKIVIFWLFSHLNNDFLIGVNNNDHKMYFYALVF